MAKGKSEAKAEGEAAEAAPRSRKKLIMVALAGLLVLGGGGGAYVFLAKKPKPDQAEAAKPKPVAFVEVREMTVNLAAEPNQERPRFLKLKVALEVKEPKVIPEIQPLMTRIEDSFQTFVRELRASELDGSAGLYRLREELLRRVNIAVHPARVDAVLFKEVVIQ